MTLDELAAAVFTRGGSLVLRDGRIRYHGPAMAADDPIRSGVREHRDALVRLATEYERRQELRVSAAQPEVAA